MVDYGTLIADAKGILHDVSQNAFDSITKGVHAPLNASSELLQHNFTQTYQTFKKNIAEKLNIDIDKGIDLESIYEQLKGQLSKQAVRVGVESAIGYGLSLAAELEGPLGILLSEAVTIAGTEFTAYMLGKQSFSPGQWVFLDYGEKTRQINEKPKVIELQEGLDIFGGENFALIPDELDYSTEAKHSIGFILGQCESTYEWKVFSFLSGREEKVHEDKIRKAPDNFAQRLDDDPDFSSVREVLFLKDHDPTLKSYIPTNKGETVFYKGQPHVIVSAAKDEYHIRSTDGTELRVHASTLFPGKTETNANWDNETIHLGSFTTQPDALYSGEWVWVKAKGLIDGMLNSHARRLAAVPPELQQMGPDSRVLALVKTIEGKHTHVVRAYDGQHMDVSTAEVLGATNKINGLLNQDRSMVKWKLTVLEGGNSKIDLPSRKHPMLTLGLGELDDEQLDTYKMLPQTKVRHDITGSAFEPVYKSDGMAQEVENKKLQFMRDEEQNQMMLTGDRTHELVPVYRASESDGPSIGGGSGPLLLIIGIAVVYTFIM
jgi:hypothetical protein